MTRPTADEQRPEYEVATPDASAPALRCVLGGRGPARLARDLGTLLELPEAVLASYAEVLEPNLADAIDDRTETRVARFAQRHSIGVEALAPSIKACRFLFTSAVRAGISVEDFALDLVALLSPEGGARAARCLCPLFETFVPELRRAAVFRSVAEHGKLVRAVRWRMDVIKGSDHALRLEVPVATLTLQYQEGANLGQVSVQLLPEQAAELRRALSMLVDER
jgi:hypothetical protein